METQRIPPRLNLKQMLGVPPIQIPKPSIVYEKPQRLLTPAYEKPKLLLPPASEKPRLLLPPAANPEYQIDQTQKPETKPKLEPIKYPKYINELNPGQFLENDDICQHTLVWFPRYCNGWNEHRYDEIGWKAGWIIKRQLSPKHKDFIWNVQDESEINPNSIINSAYRLWKRYLYR